MSKDSERAHGLKVGGRSWSLTEAEKNDGGYRVKVNGSQVPVRLIAEPGLDRPDLVGEINGQVFVAELLEKEGDQFVVRLNGRVFNVGLDVVQSAVRDSKTEEDSQGPVLVAAPMSGRVVSLNISKESKVTSGQSLVVLEAMKMQNDISAPRSGIVKEVYVQAGALVKAGDRLCLLE